MAAWNNDETCLKYYKLQNLLWFGTLSINLRTYTFRSIFFYLLLISLSYTHTHTLRVQATCLVMRALRLYFLSQWWDVWCDFGNSQTKVTVHIKPVACLCFDGDQSAESSLWQVCCGKWQDESGGCMMSKTPGPFTSQNRLYPCSA